MEDNLMGLFFKDLKDDLSESVNNLPDDTNKASDDSDDVMVNTLDDPELAKMAEAFKMEAQEYDMSEDTSSPETDMGNVSDKDETKEDIKNAAENPEYIADETAVITEGLSIKGDLDSLGSIDLFGTVSGSITGSSKANEFFANDAQVDGDIEAKGAVKIGQGTVVVGNITATSAVIGGAVKGDIDVHGPVIIDSSAIISGDIKSKSVQINNGATIDGRCSQCYADVNMESIFDIKGKKNK